jgi:polyisoprenoid-binding protein YceI
MGRVQFLMADRQTFAVWRNEEHVEIAPIQLSRMKFKLLWYLAFLVVGLPQILLATEMYTIDPLRSSLDFKVSYLWLGTMQGSFQKFKGKVVYDVDKSSLTSFEVIVQSDSIHTGDEKRDQQLKSEDFFNAAKFPTLIFKSRKIVQKDEHSFHVICDATLLGMTKPLAFMVITYDPDKGIEHQKHRGGETKFTLKRSEFGMTKMRGLVSDDVKITMVFSVFKL